MPAKRKSSIAAVKAAKREQIALDLNIARNTHLTYAEFRVPRDTNRLAESIRAEGDATPDNLRAVVKCGGIEVRGVMVSYGTLVNGGHATTNGGFVPPDPFWDEAIQAGRDVVVRRGKTRRRGP